ncbi:MAG: glycosyltransferase family 4 protein [Anaerolineae bacterium]|nr:glycosyltransferase family 4 protein [Anaerolineae bacterium]
MRIGLITGEYPPMQGGVADFTREIGRAFVAQSHTVAVLTDVRGRGAKQDGITVDARVTNWNRASLGAVERWAREQRLDVINLQYQTAAYNMAPLIHLLPRRAAPLPLVTTFHDLRVPYLFPKAGPLREWWVLRLARDSAAAIVTNSEDEQALLRAGEVRRVARIPIGSNITPAPPEDFDAEAWRARIGVKPGETLVAFFGFMNRSKGVDTLLRALAAVDTPETPFRLVMIGGRTGDSDPTNAAYAEEIDALINTLGLGDRVIWTGYVDDAAVSAHLYAADCCALPFADGVSFRRGSLMAALAHDCAIISTTPASPLPEVQDGEPMRLVPPGDAGALAAALQDVARDPMLRGRLQAGARQLHAHFGWERIAARTAELFDALI